MAMKPKLLVFLLLATLSVPGFLRAESPDLTNMGILLELNKSDIQSLDNSISNLPSAKDPNDQSTRFRAELIKEYGLAIQHDFFAQLWYLQGKYSRTYFSLRKSRGYLSNAYRRVLVNYIDDTWALLEEVAPVIVRTRDKEARHLLRLGYRDLESTRLFHQRGYNIKPTLLTNQIGQYREGIKRVRRARRYALLAIVEAKLPRSEKPQYQVVTLDDVKNKRAGRYFKQKEYDKTRNRLINLMGRKLIPRGISRGLAREVSLAGQPRTVKLLLLEIHQDNYDRLVTERFSVWRKIVSDLTASGIVTSKSLPKRRPDNRNKISRENSGPDKPTKSPPKTPKTGKKGG